LPSSVCSLIGITGAMLLYMGWRWSNGGNLP
jgi:hypothetical protein